MNATKIPRRKIVETAGYMPRTRRGIIRTAVLECGHLEDCNATDRRRGWLYCFDCFYGKPADWMGLVVLEERKGMK